LAEAEAAGIKSFEELNDSFMAWAEQVANTRVHAETKTTPIARFLVDGPPKRPDPTVVREAFRWSVTRRVTKTATVSLFANRYGVEPFLIGRTVELRFDPEDLTVIDVIFGGEVICQAVPYSIGRHVHPAVPQAIPPRQEQDGPGIDYLGLVRLAEEQAQGSGQIAYREVPLPGFVAEDSESEAQ
jgi:putative transposase